MDYDILYDILIDTLLGNTISLARSNTRFHVASKDPAEQSLNAHLHQAIISIHHALKPNPLHRSIRTPLARLSVTRWPATPRRDISLHRALHHGAIVHTHAWTDCSALEARGVEVVVSSALVVDLAGNLRCGRTSWWLRS
jgi:hypothetical protein